MTKPLSFHTVEEFIAHVGRDNFQFMLGYSTQLVTRAIKTNVMPARWFLRVGKLCNVLKIEMPEHLFNMDFSCLNTQYANNSGKNQVSNTEIIAGE